MIRKLIDGLLNFLKAAKVDTPLKQAQNMKDLAHQLGVELVFHVRHLRPGLKRMEYRGTTLLTTPNPGEAWVLMRKINEESTDVGKYYVTCEARFDGFEISPEDAAEREESRRVHAVASRATEGQPDLPLPFAPEAAVEGAGAGGGGADQPAAVEAAPVVEGVKRLDVNKLLDPPA